MVSFQIERAVDHLLGVLGSFGSASVIMVGKCVLTSYFITTPARQNSTIRNMIGLGDMFQCIPLLMPLDDLFPTRQGQCAWHTPPPGSAGARKAKETNNRSPTMETIEMAKVHNLVALTSDTTLRRLTRGDALQTGGCAGTTAKSCRCAIIRAVSLAVTPRIRQLTYLIAACLLVLVLRPLDAHTTPLSRIPLPNSGSHITRVDTRPSVKIDLSNLPLSFEANKGQVDGTVKFVSRGNG